MIFNVSMLRLELIKTFVENASCVAEIFREKPGGHFDSSSLGNLVVKGEKLCQLYTKRGRNYQIYVLLFRFLL